ncbi:nucleotide exchange factor GrpE [Paenibacillus paeoniae]|uniref:Protein GrpE n=1 Tax=Paenibacillus paeoniae TaxID=2292705 RepID=A0A371PNT1_9BACL|nr:nucleotide exchange factor GrpE [Paenibacillus paeoniae]REK77427.1 nucleotide exchange factor GrpE [Paenibacillus paeoniae]
MSAKETQNDTLDTVLDEAAQEQNGAEESAQTEEETTESARYVELVKQAEEAQQRYLRAQADFDNFRRRTVKEKEELAQYASMKLINQLLPVVDNFERAIAASSSNNDFESMAKGVDMIFRLMSQTLDAEGLKPIVAVGEPFNPEFHQAIMQVESDEYEEGIVVEEVQKGYMLKEKVLRPAMVKVSG